MPIELIFEDEHIIIAEKSTNVLVHNSYYARNIKEETLLEQLEQQLGYPVYPVHRLDRKTSGLILLAKKKDDISTFQNLFHNNEIQKKYLTVVRGFLNEDRIINSPVKHPETGIHKSAETHCVPLGKKLLNIPVHPYEKSRYSLVLLKPVTGRIHQLRIHMNKISHPIIGDAKYGDRFHNRMFETEFGSSEILLHAFSLEFLHPKSNTKILVRSKQLSEYWQSIISNFEWGEQIKTVFKNQFKH